MEVLLHLSEGQPIVGMQFLLNSEEKKVYTKRKPVQTKVWRGLAIHE
jgi:hypothetical protein